MKHGKGAYSILKKSPLGWEHINLTGDFVWRQSRKLEDGKFRPLRQVGKP